MKIVGLAYLALLPSLLLADGGMLRMRVQNGGLIISAFTSPVPLRVGLADVSVLVQSATDQTPVLDGAVTLVLSGPLNPKTVVQATRRQATNRLLYAASVDFPVPGNWTLRVDFSRARKSATASTRVDVLSKAPPWSAYWFYFALVPLGLILFALNQWLKAKRNVKGSRAEG